jgi:AraC-like DNA-binding protein
MPANTLTLGEDENPFCRLVRNTVKGSLACANIEGTVQRRAGKEMTPRPERCFAGLCVIAVPVVVGGAHVATWMAGEVLCKKPAKHEFARLAKQLLKLGCNKRDLVRAKKAYFQTPVVSQERLQAAARLLSLFAQSLSDYASHCLIASQCCEPPPVALAKDYFQTHMNERLTMRIVAHQVHLSPCYFCRIFKKATGMTFTEYASRVRVEKAKSLLASPPTRMSEVAYSAGFGSIPRFNSAFREYAGKSPSKYRLSIQRQFRN